MPDLLQNLEQLDNLVARVVVRLRRPQRLVPCEELSTGTSLPLPRRLRIPLSAEDREITPAVRIPLNERGLLLRLELTSGSRGPKDLRGEYEPVYHVLNFLGLDVAMGTEEQDGLFGEHVPTNEENYLRSLAVVLLASVADKQANRLCLCLRADLALSVGRPRFRGRRRARTIRAQRGTARRLSDLPYPGQRARHIEEGRCPHETLA